MFISATISLLVSTIFLNLGLAFSGPFLASKNINPARSGLVLGVSEYQTANKIMVQEGNNFNQAMVKVIEEVKALPLPSLPQLPQFDMPMQKSPPSRVKEATAAETVNFDLAADINLLLPVPLTSKPVLRV